MVAEAEELDNETLDAGMRDFVWGLIVKELEKLSFPELCRHPLVQRYCKKEIEKAKDEILASVSTEQRMKGLTPE